MRKQAGADEFDTDKWQLKAADTGQVKQAVPSGMSLLLPFLAGAQGAVVSCIGSYRLWTNRGITRQKNMNI